MKRVVVVATVLLATFGAVVAARADSDMTTSDMATGGQTPDSLVSALLGSGVTASNVTYTGDSTAAGSFTDAAPAAIGFNGVVLSTGAISNAIGPNDETNATSDLQQPGDADLTADAGTGTTDAAVLEFDFVPQYGTLTFSYVFASEEYPEYVGEFNDIFGLYVGGHNCALVPGTNPPVPVSINNVNDHTNSAYYRDNNDGNLNTEFDGLTTALTCTASVTPGQSTHVKLAVADANDHEFDTAVFVKAASFSTTSTTTSTTAPTTSTTVAAHPGSFGPPAECTGNGGPVPVYTDGLNHYLSVCLDGAPANGVTYVQVDDAPNALQGGGPLVEVAVGADEIDTMLGQNGLGAVYLQPGENCNPDLNGPGTDNVVDIAFLRIYTDTLNHYVGVCTPVGTVQVNELRGSQPPVTVTPTGPGVPAPSLPSGGVPLP